MGSLLSRTTQSERSIEIAPAYAPGQSTSRAGGSISATVLIGASSVHVGAELTPDIVLTGHSDQAISAPEPTVTKSLPSLSSDGPSHLTGLDEFDERWLRLALVIHETSTAALKPVLEDVISTKYTDLVNKSFEEKLETALLRDEKLVYNSLLVYERQTVFPSSGVAGSFQDFDIGIVGKLIKFYVGKSIWAKEASGLPGISNLQCVDLTKISRFASVELLREYRNWVFHYTGNPPMNEVEFSRHWNQLFIILQCLGYDTSRVSKYRSGLVGYGNNWIYEKSKELLKDLHSFKSEMICKVDAIQKISAELVTKEDLKHACEEFGKMHAAGHLEVVTDDVKRRAQEACWRVHERLLKCRELDIYGEQIDGKPKRDMMVSLETVRSKEVDSFRLHQGNEIEEHLKRSRSDLKAVAVHEIFNSDHVVLVRGLPGSGKSTLCHFILREWQAGRLWKERFYDFIFYVNAPFAINLLHPGPFNADSVLKVLYPDVFCEMEYDQLRKFNYLVIVDSIDECDVERICSLTELMSAEFAIRQLITSPEKYDRIVVGRPQACDKVRTKLLKNVAFEYVEVVGFSTEQLKLYVNKFCEPDYNKAAVVWQKISDNKSLFGMVHRPVFANIACNIFAEDSSVQIERQTELYVWTYAVFVARHFKNHPSHGDVSTFEKLFCNEYLLDALAKVSSMAFTNLTSGKIFFQASGLRLSEIELTFLSPFLVQRQQFLCFSHLTLMEFLAAVHLFLTGVKFCEAEFILNEHLRGVLPMYFGLLGSLVKHSDSATIVKNFSRPLRNKFDIKPVHKHPLCGKVGQLVYDMDVSHYMFLHLCYEFGNRRLLKDRNFYWNNQASLYVRHHDEFDRLFFVMTSSRTVERGIETLTINLDDEDLSIEECHHLNDALVSCRWKVDELELLNVSVNEDKMRILAPAFCSVRGVQLWNMDVSSDECWRIFVRSLEDSKSRRTLRIERLVMRFGCNMDESFLSRIKSIVRDVDVC